MHLNVPETVDWLQRTLWKIIFTAFVKKEGIFGQKDFRNILHIAQDVIARKTLVARKRER
jgi:hypothetical protein